METSRSRIEMLTDPTVSAIMTFHGEKVLANFALRGFTRMRQASEAAGICIELVAVLDCADDETTRIVKEHPAVRKSDQILEVKNGDLASSRNDGIRRAKAPYIAILDGDDYYSKEWFVSALQTASTARGKVIVHPELTISFGAVHCVAETYDMDSGSYPLAGCMMAHPWVSCSFGSRDVYLNHPYQPTHLRATGFGYEDWHWNLETIAHGIRHVTAPRTALYYRRKASSMVTEMAQNGATVRPSLFFGEPEKWQNGFCSKGGVN
ncbi:glycosyltransferase family 2 protein [Cupriavidus taiwanensis]|uniref:glycosyltransferase family 2 protein n=1 Tax=Cupriavidus taiwanensis TaxID=164546 RepID=UPI001F11FA16|nr:glycosyltransferase family A protein [Cupriavidus taiwanensis]